MRTCGIVRKLIIGFGSIWGLYAFGGMLFSLFTIGTTDSAPEVLAILLNGLTILPSCILAIWFMRYAAIWLILLSPVTALGLVYKVIHSRNPPGGYRTVVGVMAEALIVAAIPGAIGLLLFRAANHSPNKSHFLWSIGGGILIKRLKWMRSI
jgi:hypothetical protein